MAEILQRFGSNPFSTPVGQKIEQATDPSLQSENWALNMEICDLVNETEDGPRDASRALKKRLQITAGKNFPAFLLTLTVLETCVKNCNKRFHVLVTTKDFVQDLFKLIGPKNDPPLNIQERVLSIIQSWAEAFHGQPDMQGVCIYYNELRNKGVQFPKSQNEPKVPIHTPARSHPAHSVDSSVGPSYGTSPPRASSAPGSSSTLSSSSLYPIHLSPEQLNKLKNEIEIVQGNMNVLSEMLAGMDPTNEHEDDAQLMKDLHSTCVDMQKRIVVLIEKVSNEEVTNELLRINDELNNLFTRYERYQKKQPSSTIAQAAAGISPVPSSSGKALKSNINQNDSHKVQSLIDFSDEIPQNDPIVQSLNNIKLNDGAGDSDFDTFAQTRSNPGPSTSSYSNSNQFPATSKSPQPIGGNLMSFGQTLPSSSTTSTLTTSTKPLKADELKEMNDIEQWLSQDTQDTPSLQFDNFLRQREQALEQQPNKNNDKTLHKDNSLI